MCRVLFAAGGHRDSQYGSRNSRQDAHRYLFRRTSDIVRYFSFYFLLLIFKMNGSLVDFLFLFFFILFFLPKMPYKLSISHHVAFISYSA